MIPRALVAEALGVGPDALPPGDLPVPRLAQRFMDYLRDAFARDDTGQHPEFWTFALYSELITRRPELALAVALACLDLCADAEEAALLAAGPLEDLLDGAGPAVIEQLEILASDSPRLRYALSGVWLQGAAGQKLLGRVRAAAGDAPGIEDGAPLPPV